MKQTVLVLGAAGFIGRSVVRELATSGWVAPVAAVRRPSVGMADSGVGVVSLDATETAALSRAMQGIDGVVNCVAGNADTLLRSTEAIFAAAAAQPRPPRVVHLSSMAVYGSAEGLVAETAPLRGDLGDYSLAKIAAEQIAARYPRAVILRPSCVYGPDGAQWTTRFARWLQARRLGDLGAAGDGICNLIHVRDLADAVLRSLRTEAAEQQAFNISNPVPLTWNDYLYCFAKTLGAVPIRRISARRLKIETRLLAPPLKIAGIAARKARLHLPLPEPIPPTLLRLMAQEITLDVRKSIAILGLRPTPLEQGLREAAASVAGSPVGAALPQIS